MAYNYYPATYQPYYQQQYYPQMQQQTQPHTSMIWVSGEQEAQSYPVAPNNAVALWDSNGAAIYLKQADASGKPSIRTFDLVERAQNVPAGVSAAGDRVTDYATKTELDALSVALTALQKEVQAMKGERDE